MNKTWLIFGCGLPAALLIGWALGRSSGVWRGVDETIVEAAAEKAGRPATPPLINTDRGDLPLFIFLTAGSVGGFVAGYYARGVFGNSASQRSNGAGR